MKNKIEVEYFNSINEELIDSSERISKLKKEYIEILKSGVSKETFLAMVEYDFDIYKLKKYLNARAACYSKEECEKQRYKADKIQSNITSLDDAKEKVLALHLADNELNK